FYSLPSKLLTCPTPTLFPYTTLFRSSARAKEMSEAQGGVARNGARSVQDLGDAIGRHVDLPRQFSRAHIECFQFFSQVFTRMDSGQCHSDAPNDTQQSPRL